MATEYFGVSHIYGRFRVHDDQGVVRSDDELHVAADEDYAQLCEWLQQTGDDEPLDRQVFDEGYLAGYWHGIHDHIARTLGREWPEILRNSRNATGDGARHAVIYWPRIADDDQLVKGARMSYDVWANEMTWDEFVAGYRYGYWVQVAVKRRPNETLYW